MAENRGRGRGQSERGLDNQGQQKTHQVWDREGNVVEGGMTQAEWRERDKSEGLTRDDPFIAEPEVEEPSEEETTDEPSSA